MSTAPARAAPPAEPGQASRLRVLIISHSFPFPARWGYATRVAQLARQLARRHDVTLLTYATARDDVTAAEVPTEVVRRRATPWLAKRVTQLASLLGGAPFSIKATRSNHMQAAIDRLCAAHAFDVVQLEGAVLADFRIPSGTPVVLDEHNIDYEVFDRMRYGERSFLRRSLYRVEGRRFRRFEQECWSRVDGCVVTSEREARIVEEFAPGTPIGIVPNAVDVDRFRPTGRAAEPRTIVFNGALDYRPNLDAAETLVRDVLPVVRARYSDARLVIVGRGSAADAERLSAPGVHVVGEVADVRPFLERAAVVAVPIRMGGGTRFKVLEGMAMARPIVSTTVGSEGIAVVAGKHVLIGDDTESFAAAVTRAFDDARLCERLGTAGRDLVEREYSWTRAGDRLEELYRRVIPARVVTSSR